MEEIWKDIKGYENLYQVSNFGRVKSVSKHIKHYRGGLSLIKERIISQHNVCGYMHVSLSNAGIQTMFKTHRLVAIAFIPNLLNKTQINHINGIKSDNNILNLEWVTPSENTKHAHATGLHKGSHRGLLGKLNPHSKPVFMCDINTKKIIRMFDNITIAGKEMNIHPQNISYACNGKYKQAKGYVWKYAI